MPHTGVEKGRPSKFLDDKSNKLMVPGIKEKELSKRREKRKSVDGHEQSKALSVGSLVPGGEREEESAGKDLDHIFALISKNECETLQEMSPTDMESYFKGKFELSPVTNLKDAAVLDYYVGAAYWAKSQDFTSVQYAGFLLLMNKLLHNITDDRMLLVDVITQFRKSLVGIGVYPTPSVPDGHGGFEFFTSEQGKAITDYLYVSLFQHFKLYEFMFAESQSEEIVTNDLTVEVPFPADMPFPPPLEEGILEETLRDFLDVPLPAQEEEAEEGKVAEEVEVKPLTPTEIQLPPEADDLMARLSADEVKQIIQEVSEEFLKNFQVGVENKLRNQETIMLSKINKIHVVPPTSETELPAK